MQPFASGPATDMQIRMLRSLAGSDHLPQPAAVEYAEQAIALGLEVNEAYALIGRYGERIRDEARRRRGEGA